jgi:osmotically-inducible protein OsmY
MAGKMFYRASKPSADNKEEYMTYKSDEEIRDDALFQLDWGSRLRLSDIGVTVKKGVVTLTGTVDSYAKKLAAQKAAHSVPGVLDVANDIEVKVAGRLRRTDSEIARATRHALEWDALVSSYKIHSTVTNGWVTLDGEVEYYSEWAEAERAVSRLPGVRGVTNKIAVCAPLVEPLRVKSLIEDTLVISTADPAAAISNSSASISSPISTGRSLAIGRLRSLTSASSPALTRSSRVIRSVCSSVTFTICISLGSATHSGRNNSFEKSSSIDAPSDRQSSHSI